MTINKLFPKILLVVGLSVFLASMPGPVAYAGSGQPKIVTETYWDGHSETTTYNEQGQRTSKEIDYPDGSASLETYERSSQKLTSITVKDRDGTTRTLTYKPPCDKGKEVCHVTSITTDDPRMQVPTRWLCDKADEYSVDKNHCTDWRKTIMATPNNPPADKKPPFKVLPGGRGGIGGKDRLQAEVLQQIEGKPRGDPKGSTEKLQTEDNKAEMKAGFARGEIPPGSKIGGTYNPDRRKLLMDEKLRSKPDGLQTGGTQQINAKSIGQDITAGQKEKLVPRSQSTGKIFQGGAAAKQKLQTQAVQQNKFKPKYQRWGTSAGSSEAFRAPK